MVTNNGIYTFTGSAGTYVVSTTSPAGFVNSTPTPATRCGPGVDNNDNGVGPAAASWPASPLP